MIDEVVRLREQAMQARRLASATTDGQAGPALIAYADDCEAKASSLQVSRKKAKDQPSRF